MATKVNALSAEERFFIWAEAVRYNADPIVAQLDNGDPVFMIRLRPWKQDKRFPVMFVGSGDTLIAAMRGALTDYKEGEEKPLDYAYRPWATTRDAVTTPDL